MFGKITVYGIRDYAGEKMIWFRTREAIDDALWMLGHSHLPKVEEAKMTKKEFALLGEWDG